MTDAATQFTTVATALAGEVTRQQMMGCPTLMREGRMVACLDKDVFAVKLGRTRDEHAEALGIPGAALWSPKESHRQFSDWVGLPLSQSSLWLDWARTAIDIADELALTSPPKPKSRPTSRPSGGGGGI